jgi:dephospho-CoA kinase
MASRATFLIDPCSQSIPRNIRLCTIDLTLGQSTTDSYPHNHPATPVVALIGGVGSGKSALAHWISRQLNTVIVDGDVAGHRALEQPLVREQIRRRFGNEVFDSQERIRRDRLAELVFGQHDEHRRARRDLEQIVHPVIRGDLQQQVAAARGDSAVDVVLLDAAVLLEAGWNEICDAVIFVDTPIEQRQSRVAARGWTTADLKRREESQLSLTEKRAAADFVIDNSGPLENAGRQLLEILKQLRIRS